MNITDTSTLLIDSYMGFDLGLSFNKKTGIGTLTSIKVTRKAIHQLYKNRLFIEYTTPLWEQYFIGIAPDVDSEIVNLETFNFIDKNYKALDIALHSTNLILSPLVPKSTQDSIRIKLPHTNNFSDLSKVSNELNKAISIPIAHKDIKGNTTIESVENGSIWLIVALASPLAVGLVGAITWGSAVINKKKQEAIIFEQHVKSLSLANDEKQMFLDAQKKQIDLLTETETKNIKQEFYKKSDPEDLERLKHSIVTISGLINKGLEIHPSLSAPENVSNLFPDFKKLNLIESKTKLIDNQ